MNDCDVCYKSRKLPDGGCLALTERIKHGCWAFTNDPAWHEKYLKAKEDYSIKKTGEAAG